MPVLFALTWINVSLSYPTDVARNVEAEESASVNSTSEDEEFSWYKPVAVILKPATRRDFQELLKGDQMEELLHPPHRYPYDHHSLRSPYWPPAVPQDSWELPDPEEFPPYQGRHYERPDRLRDAYERFDLPDRVQSNLLSLARMGLVAIPTKEIGRGKNDVSSGQGIFYSLICCSIIFNYISSCLDVQSRRGQHYAYDKQGHGYHENHKPGKKDKVPAAWLYDLVGPPGPPGPIGPQGLF